MWRSKSVIWPVLLVFGSMHVSAIGTSALYVDEVGSLEPANSAGFTGVVLRAMQQQKQAAAASASASLARSVLDSMQQQQQERLSSSAAGFTGATLQAMQQQQAASALKTAGFAEVVLKALQQQQKALSLQASQGLAEQAEQPASTHVFTSFSTAEQRLPGQPDFAQDGDRDNVLSEAEQYQVFPSFEQTALLDQLRARRDSLAKHPAFLQPSGDGQLSYEVSLAELAKKASSSEKGILTALKVIANIAQTAETMQVDLEVVREGTQQGMATESADILEDEHAPGAKLILSQEDGMLDAQLQLQFSANDEGACRPVKISQMPAHSR